jgi:hypothetical protein
VLVSSGPPICSWPEKGSIVSSVGRFKRALVLVWRALGPKARRRRGGGPPGGREWGVAADGAGRPGGVFACSTVAYPVDGGAPMVLGSFETADPYQAVAWARAEAGRQSKRLEGAAAGAAGVWAASRGTAQTAVELLVHGRPLRVEIGRGGAADYLVAVSRARSKRSEAAS